METHRTIPNNKPDIIIHDSKQGACALLDVAIPGHRNVIKKEAEKIFKNKDLVIRNSAHVEFVSKVISVIIRATGTISESLRQYLSNVPGKNEIKELQKNNNIGHCTRTVESNNVKVQNTFHVRNNITRSTNCKYRAVATLYTLDTWFDSGI